MNYFIIVVSSYKKNNVVMLTSQADTLPGDMMSWRHLINIKCQIDEIVDS